MRIKVKSNINEPAFERQRSVMCGLLILFIASAFMMYGFSFQQFEITLVDNQYPANWPKPAVDFKRNPITDDGFILGRELFYDPLLSRDSTISCASCHLQYTGFTHVDHAVSHGIDGRVGTRNAPVLINLAWSKQFHWDGGVKNLEGQAVNPLTHKLEMDNDLVTIRKKLKASSKYRQLFYVAFKDSSITTAHLLKAISQFTRSLISCNSKYDKVKQGELAFSDQEGRGYRIFQNHCASCHKEPLFTTNECASNGLSINPYYNDLGKYAVSGVGKDSLQFKIPTLRNSEFSFPYMHDGRFRKLKDVINYYSDSLVVSNRYISSELRKPMRFNETEKKDLLAFLLTLTDKAFLYNPRFSYPRSAANFNQ